MDFQEQGVDAHRRRRPCHVGHILALPAAAGAFPSGDLHAVGGVHDHGIAQFTHDGQPPHIGDQCVVTEAGTAFCEKNVVIACRFQLGNDVFHIPGRQELPFFHIDAPAALACRVHQVRLPAEERGDLEDVQHLRRFFHLACFMYVADDGNAQFLFDARQLFQPFFQSGSPEGIVGRTVGFVKRCLEYVRHAQFRADALHFLPDGQAVFITFQHAGSGQQQQGLSGSDLIGSHIDDMHCVLHSLSFMLPFPRKAGSPRPGLPGYPRRCPGNRFPVL